MFTLLGLAYLGAVNVFFCVLREVYLPDDRSCSHRSHYRAITTAWSGVSVIADLLLIIGAITAIWRTKMSVTARVTASILLAFAASGGFISFVRWVVLLRSNIHRANDDRSAVIVSLTVIQWSVVECGATIAMASLATIRPLLVLVREWLRPRVPWLLKPISKSPLPGWKPASRRISMHHDWRLDTIPPEMETRHMSVSPNKDWEVEVDEECHLQTHNLV